MDISSLYFIICVSGFYKYNNLANNCYNCCCVFIIIIFFKMYFLKLNVIHIALMHNETTLKHFMLYVNDVKNNREKQP